MTAARVRLAAGVLVTGLLALFAGLAPGVPRGSGQPADSGQSTVAVGRTVLACARAYTGDHAASTVTTGAWPADLPPAASRQLEGADSSVSTSLLPPSGGAGTNLPAANYRSRGVPAQAAVPAGSDRAVQVVATGLLAPGATASVSTKAPVSDSTHAGLAEQACTEPGADFWLTGLSEALGEHATIDLVNVDDGPAQVDVTLYDDKGTVAAPGTSGLRVPAHGRTSLDLDQLAPGSAALAVQVHAVSGRVVAAARQSGTSGEASLGNGWLPASAQPARTLVLPGVAAGVGKVTLTLMAPGKTAGTATIRLLTPNGPIQPAGRNRLSLTPGQVTTADLSDAVAGEVAAVQVRATVPIVAGLRQQAVPAKRAVHDTDLAMLAPAHRLDGPVAMAGAPAGAAGAVLLTAPGPASTATVAVVGDDGHRRHVASVKVPAGSTVSSPLPTSAAGDMVVVTPAHSGRLLVARVASDTAAGVPQLSVLQPAPPVLQAIRATLQRSLR